MTGACFIEAGGQKLKLGRRSRLVFQVCASAICCRTTLTRWTAMVMERRDAGPAVEQEGQQKS